MGFYRSYSSLVCRLYSKAVTDGRVGVTTRHLVGIDATLHNSWQTQLQPKRPDMPQSCSGLAH